jgi:hypothetical protein
MVITFRLESLARNFTDGSEDLSDVTFISIHVRRTDYAHHMSVLWNMSYVNTSYFHDAIKYYKSNYNVSVCFCTNIWPLARKFREYE